jgi:hypothetical protein
MNEVGAKRAVPLASSKYLGDARVTLRAASARSLGASRVIVVTAAAYQN